MDVTAPTWTELPRVLSLCSAQSVITWRGPSGSCGQLLVELSRSCLPGGKENLSEQLWHPKSHVCGILQLHRAVCAGRERRKEGLLEADKLQVCPGAALLFWCVPRAFHTRFWAALDAPIAGEGPLAPCAAPEYSTSSFLLVRVSEDLQTSVWGNAAWKTYRTTISYSDSCDTEVKKETRVDSLEERYFCHLQTW